MSHLIKFRISQNENDDNNSDSDANYKLSSMANGGRFTWRRFHIPQTLFHFFDLQSMNFSHLNQFVSISSTLSRNFASRTLKLDTLSFLQQ